MRRLVDVDELIKYFDEYLEGYDNREYILQMLDTKGRIERVEAIPIEWIKNWCVKHYPTYPRIITEELLKKTETWRMIEDWEKENETN